METQTTSRFYIVEKSGLLIAFGLLIFFFIMRAFGLLYIVELRVFNAVIMIVGIRRAITEFGRLMPDHFSYFKGLSTGVLAGIIGSLLFGLFVFIYISFIDKGLMQSIIENEPMGRFMNPYIVSIIIAVEGIASALLISFILMNYISPTKIE